MTRVHRGCALVLAGLLLSVLLPAQQSQLAVAGISDANPTTVAKLPPAANYNGTTLWVVDSTTATSGGTVAGGGSIVAPVKSNGTNWIVQQVGGASGGTAPYTQSFTNQTIVPLTHNLGTTSVIVQCWDNQSAPQLIAAKLVKTDANTVTATFGSQQTGSCTVNGGVGPQGATGPAGSGSSINVGVNSGTATSSSALNIVQGTNTTVTQSNSGGTATVTISSTGGGAVSSVAGRTGAVTLTHSDLTDWASATSGFTGGGTDTSGVIHTLNGYSCAANGTTDDTTCINNAIAAACTGTGIKVGSKVFLDVGNYAIAGKLVVNNCQGLVFEGAGHKSNLILTNSTGTTSSPTPAGFEIHCRDCVFKNFAIAPNTGFYKYPIAVTNKDAVYAAAGQTYTDSGHNLFENIYIDVAGHSWSIIGMPLTDSSGNYGSGGLDANNDITTFRHIQGFNFGGACFTIEGTQNHNIYFDQDECAVNTYGLNTTGFPNGSAAGVAGCYDGSCGAKANFYWHLGYINVNSKSVPTVTYSGHAPFYIGGPQVLPYVIDGVSIEGSCMVFDTEGSTSFAGNLTVRDVRWGGNAYTSSTSNCPNYPVIGKYLWAGGLLMESNNWYGPITSGNAYGYAIKFLLQEGSGAERHNFRIVNDVFHSAKAGSLPTITDIVDTSGHAFDQIIGVTLTWDETGFANASGTIFKDNNGSTPLDAVNGTQVTPFYTTYEFSGTVPSGGATVYGFQDQYYPISRGYSFIVRDSGCTASSGNPIHIQPQNSGKYNNSTSDYLISTACGEARFTFNGYSGAVPMWTVK